MSGFEIHPEQLGESGDKLGRFGEELVRGGQKLQSTGQSLVAHASADKSGIGAVITKAFGRGMEVTGKVFGEGGRVVDAAGKRLRINGENHRGNDDDIAHTLRGIDPDAKEPGKPHVTGGSGGGATSPSGAGGGGGRIRGSLDALGDKARNAAKTAKNRLGFGCGDPIDPVTGDAIYAETDVALPGMLPLVLQRVHISSYRTGAWFGPSWSSTLDESLEVDADGVYFASADGMLLSYPRGTDGVASLPVEGPRLTLAGSQRDGYAITDPRTGRTRHFAVTDPSSAATMPLVAITDRNAHRIDLLRDDSGAPIEIRHSGGYRVGVDTAGGRVTALRLRHAADDGGDVALARYGYDANGDLTEIVNDSGQPVRFDYDADHRMTGWIDRNGNVYRYHYDERGRCIRTEGTGGYLSGTFTYAENVTTYADSLGHTSVFHLNGHRQIVRRTDPLGHDTTFDWDRYDRLLAQTDQLGHTTGYAYDEDGNVTEVTGPDGGRTTVAYGDLARPVTVTQPNGAVWRREFDAAGNLLVQTDPAGATSRYEYAEHGHLVLATDALGGVTRVECDAAGLPLSITDPSGATTTYRRDAFGRVAAILDAAGGTTRLGWTVAGRLAWRTLPDGATERWHYDAEGNQLEHVDPLGQRTRTEYGDFDLAVAHVDASGARTTMDYDTERRLVAVTNPAGQIWRYDYDAAGHIVTETDVNGRTLRFERDATGRVTTHTNGIGQTIALTHDAMGRLLERRTDDDIATFSYDEVGQLVHATNGSTDLALNRDPLGRVLAETSNGRTLVSGYDPLGRRVERITPGGTRTRWDFDAASRVAALHTNGHTLAFDYDAGGREVSRRLGAVTLTQSWDPNHRLHTQAVVAPEPGPPHAGGDRGQHLMYRRAYTYRVDGEVSDIVDQLGDVRHFTMDALGRVTGVEGTNHRETYAYDAIGNISHATWPGADGPREHTGTAIRSSGNTRYEYDGQGRLTTRRTRTLSGQDRAWRYTWNSQDQLTTVTTPDGITWRYTYDPFGRRTSKQRLTPDGRVAEQTDFTWDGTVLAEQSHSDGRNTSWNYKPGTFTPVAQTETAVGPDAARHASQEWIDQRFYAIVTDVIGAPSALFDADGTLAWRQSATLWGAPLPNGAQRVDCPLRFPGQYHDAETGYHYNYLRYYDPATAAYLSADPAGQAGGANPYRYVPNPYSWVDPFGLKCEDGDSIPRYAGVDFRTPPGKAYFWTGETNGVGGEDYARAYATARGGYTLESFLDDRGITMPDWQDRTPEAEAEWKAASSAFSQGASGPVHTLFGQDRRVDNVYEGDELPILRDNPNVTRIVHVDPSTHVETEYLRR